MRQILLALALCGLFFSSFAQHPGAGQARTGNRGGGQGMSMGHFYGKIVDKKTSRGVDAASVQLVRAQSDTASTNSKEVVVAGMLTRANGEFSLENLPVMGSYQLKITAIGYKPYDQKVSFSIRMPQGGGQGQGNMESALAAADKDLGNIKLEADAQLLQGVTVTASKPLIQMGVDRKIFNVEKNLVSAGQTAQEIMKSIPSVNVDVDGNVTLRNAAPQIFVDGRPSTLSLDQIPADAIESVEIITNPSAKFDASGGNAGILNIVLKKNRKAGFNGNIRTGIDSRAKVNAGGDLNVRQGKVNAFISGNFNQRKSLSSTSTFRHNLLTPVDVNQLSDGKNNGTFAFTRAGLDYLIDNRNTITVSGNFVRGSFKNYDDLKFDSSKSGVLTTRANQITDSKSQFRNTGAVLSYKHNFAQAGKEVSADLNYNSSNNDNNGMYTTYLARANGTPLSPILRKTIGDGSSKFYTAQVDFSNPITENMKFETGARVAVRDNSNLNDNYFYNSTTQSYVKSASFSSNYKFTDRVYAAYLTFANKVGTWSYQGGLRAESSNYTGTLYQTKDTTFKTKYPISLFPSVFITKQLTETQDLQLNYSRRINRPNFFQLNPAIDPTDPQNLAKGNPGLKPEFTNSFEMSYQKSFPKGHNLLTTLYYKNSNNLITRYIDYTDSVYYITYRNANSSRSYGLEVTVRDPIVKWWEMITNFNLYNSKINGIQTLSSTEKSVSSQERVSYFIKWNNTFRLPASFSIQLSGDYQSRSVLPQNSSNGGGGGRGGQGGGGGGWGGGSQPTAQGYINPNYGFDLAVRKDLFKNKASISLSVNDFLKTRKYSYYSEATTFTQTYERVRDQRVFRLNFNYRFGKMDVSLFKRKNNRSEQDMQDVQTPAAQ